MRFLTIGTEHGESRVELHDGEWIVGRSRNAHIRVEDPHVSGKHICLHVADDAVTVSNLSRFGCILDNQAVTQRVPWPEGRVITVSQTVFMKWSQSESEGSLATSTLPRVGDTSAATSSGTSATRNVPTENVMRQSIPENSDSRFSSVDLEAAAPPGDTGAESKTGIYTDTEKDRTEDGVAIGNDHVEAEAEEDGVTRELHTRLAVTKDLERLRAIHRKAHRRRFWGMMGILGTVVALGLVFRPRARDPEIEVAWPKDDQGRMLEKSLEAPLGGYRVIVPDVGIRVLREDQGVLLLRCDVGRDANIPLQVLIEEYEPANHWTMTLPDLVRQWMAGKSGADDAWLFDDPLMDAMFIGGGSGLPFAFIRYTRRDGSGRDWAGTARLFRNGPRFSAVQTEAPLRERARMSGLLSRYFLQLPEDFIDASWEPVPHVHGGSGSVRLHEARQMGSERDAPAFWPDVILAFREALTLASRNGDVVTLNSAVQELADFRKKQRLFYDGLYLQFHAASERNDRERAAQIREIGKAAFADSNDARFHYARAWRLPE